MAIRRRIKAAAEQKRFRCRDCANSYDWHKPANDGHLIFCRCKFDAKSEYGRWCKFLSDFQCEQFKHRINNGTIG